MSGCFKKFDIFSMPFQFQVGDSKKKQTTIGGLFSFILFVISLAYLYYMLYLYFGNKVQPSINLRRYVETSQYVLPFDEEYIFFQFSVQGQNLNDYQASVNKTYFQISTYSEYYLPYDGVRHEKLTPLVDCVTPEFLGYFCIGPANVKQIMEDPITTAGQTFSIRIEPCDPTIYNNCATPDELVQFNNYQNYLQLFVKVKQYNPSSQRFEEQVYFEYQYIDINTYIYSRLRLGRGKTDVIQGSLFQTSEETLTLYEYSKIDNFMTYSGTQTRMNMNAYTYITLEPSQDTVAVTIQYPMITAILAQFLSVFNCLVLVGIALRFLAHSYIYEDLSILLLKNYYKKTAMKLLITNQNSPKSLKNSEMIKQNMDNVQNIIESADFQSQSQSVFQMSASRRIKLMLTSLLGTAVDYPREQKTDSSQVFNKLIQKTVENMNIFSLYTDIIRLKMAIKLLFTREQYAAFFYCGSELDPLSTTTTSQSKETKEQRLQQKIKDKYKAEEVPKKRPSEKVQFSLNENALPELNKQPSFSDRLQQMTLQQKTSHDQINENQLNKSSDLTDSKSKSPWSSPSNVREKQYIIDNIDETRSQNEQKNMRRSSLNLRSSKFQLVQSLHKGQHSTSLWQEGDIEPLPNFETDPASQRSILHLNMLNSGEQLRISHTQYKKTNLIPQQPQFTLSHHQNRLKDSHHQYIRKQKSNENINLNVRNTSQIIKSIFQEDEENQRHCTEDQEMTYTQFNSASFHKLKDMDEIESNPSVRLQFMKLFLSRMRANSISYKNASQLDVQIFENLIFELDPIPMNKNK